MDLLNKMPEEDHGCDFSRVKPWYLDGKAAHLRQSLLFSSLDAPEIRALFNRSCVNRAGKLRAVRHLEGVLDRVPQGLKQIWNRFDTHDLHDEDDKRFDFFTAKVRTGEQLFPLSPQRHRADSIPTGRLYLPCSSRPCPRRKRSSLSPPTSTLSA